MGWAIYLPSVTSSRSAENLCCGLKSLSRRMQCVVFLGRVENFQYKHLH